MNKSDRHNHLFLAGLVLLCAGLAGCTNMGTMDLGGPSIFAAKVPFVVPAKNAAASSLRSMSLVPIANPGSQLIARDVEGKMVALKFREQPFYSKVMLNGLAPVSVFPLSAFQATAQRDQTAGVMTVSFADQHIDRRNYQETRYTCASKGNGFFRNCPKADTRTTQVACEEHQAFVSIELRVYDARQKRVVYSDMVSESAKQSLCSDAAGQIADNVILGQAFAAAEQSMVNAIAPSTQLRPLDLMDSDSAVAAANLTAATKFEEAMQFARGRRLEESCNRFAELYDGNKESVALTYNMGFCDEARGDLINADALYHRASDLAGAPNGQITRHLNLVQQQIRENGLVPVASGSGINHRFSDNGSPVVSSGRRVALIVGNSRYKRGALTNPVNDARLVQTQLKKLGFQVTEVEDVTSARFQSVVTDFVTKSKGADVAMFYYAGHAIQVDGENLLLGVDNEAMRTVEDVREHGLALGALLAQLDVAAPRLKLVVLDACRDNPLPGATRSLSGGLAPIRTPPAGSLIAFATGPGQTATDGNGKNSVFTKYFAKEIQNPDQRLEDVFKKVRADVQRETGNKQKPTEVSSMVGDFFFRPTIQQ